MSVSGRRCHRRTAAAIGSIVVVVGLLLAACGTATRSPSQTAGAGSLTTTSISPTTGSTVRPPGTTSTTDPATTTTDPATPTTTTTGPATTTTAPATTTTAPATTTTGPATTTTGPATTTTTTTQPSTPSTVTVTHSTTTSSTWWWLALALVLAAILVTLIVMVVRRHGQKEAELAWRRDTIGVLDGARLARDLLPASGSAIVDTGHWGSVRERVEQAAQGLDRAGAAALSNEDASAARTTAEALRGVVFALEADRLLRDGAQAPSPEQLGQADAAYRARAADLDTALGRLDALVTPRPDDTAPA